MTHTPALRPAWTPLTIFLMVLGFIAFWPLGLAMLAYILWGDRWPEFRRQAGEFKRGFAWDCGPGMHQSRSYGGYAGTSGNAAFDEYRTRELKRLQEERRRLEEERKEFETFMRNLRMARDKEEFDRFMAERRARGTSGPANDSPIDV
jgi:hypothetical protein